MIEILVSVVVLSVGLMGLGGLQIAAIKGSNDAHFRTEASLLLMDLGDRMRANLDGVGDGHYRFTQSAINCASPPAKKCGSIACDSEVLAKFDQYQIVCSMHLLLPDSALSVSCDQDDCEATILADGRILNKTHKLNISWKEAKGKELHDNHDAFYERDIEIDIVP